jgi:hypothetical protein
VLQTRQERLSVAWFVTGGRFERATVDVDESSVDNPLVLESTVSSARLWVVLRDDRGASAAATLSLTLGL